MAYSFSLAFYLHGSAHSRRKIAPCFQLGVLVFENETLYAVCLLGLPVREETCITEIPTGLSPLHSTGHDGDTCHWDGRKPRQDAQKAGRRMNQEEETRIVRDDGWRLQAAGETADRIAIRRARQRTTLQWMAQKARGG